MIKNVLSNFKSFIDANIRCSITEDTIPVDTQESTRVTYPSVAWIQLQFPIYHSVLLCGTIR